MRILATLIAAAMVAGTVCATTAFAEPTAEFPIGEPGSVSNDGVRVGYFEYGPADGPVVATTGGWPGDSKLAAPLAAALAERGMHVIRWDMRGAGASDHPTGPHAYSMENLVADFGAVIDHVAPHRPVHIVGEGWPAFIASQYTNDHPGRIASISSVGFPALDLAGNALRRVPQEKPQLIGQWAQQMAALSYLAGIQIPELPELAVRTGIPVALLGIVAQAMTDPSAQLPPTDPRDDVDGLQRYRQANWPHLTQPAYDYIDVPVLQVFQMDDDFLETPILIDGLAERTPHLELHTLHGNHFNAMSGDNGVQILDAATRVIRDTE
ncbi:alpha/beta fold hydrolase [Nocardia brasiliensis]|uniref:Short chain dehydrogenase n=1 Tax=Nocardia brasiliensis (strain ATCC 700358 / HUJEG-1) TaxID=1133849 RepID=K0F4R8_NOCB7|nr:alpha/beta fold hydrolase [Nocardia brasiliensis]AFU02531.1 short chain dehydrogenase [Nocardia brasiliensis ATCC 700358]OCF86488.1 hypothetical protein AW168_30880 [Nocardia brasiliensis]